jgi:hypothetical protein
MLPYVDALDDNTQRVSFDLAMRFTVPYPTIVIPRRS